MIQSCAVKHAASLLKQIYLCPNYMLGGFIFTAITVRGDSVLSGNQVKSPCEKSGCTFDEQAGRLEGGGSLLPPFPGCRHCVNIHVA